MKPLSRIAALICTLFAMSGCGLLSPQLDKAAEAAGKLVAFYCENVTLPEVREKLRAAVNAKAAPHSVNVTCANGGPSLQTSLEDFNHDHYSGPVEISPQATGAPGGNADFHSERSRGCADGRPGSGRTGPRESERGTETDCRRGSSSESGAESAPVI